MPLLTMTAGTRARASHVNANFAICVLTDTSRTITATHTWSASQTFTGGFTTAAAVTLGGNLLFTDATYDIGASGATRPRDFFLSRNATIGGTLGVTGATTLSAALTYGGVTLSNAVTGTGNMVLSASPTLSGTVGGALTFSGALTLSSALTYGGVTLSNAVTGTGNMVLSASPTFTGTITAAAVNFSGALTALTGAFGGTPSTTGAVRVPNNDGLYARDAANSANIPIIILNNGNEVTIGDSTHTINVLGNNVFFNNIGTTASAANAFLDSGNVNNIKRSTSSLRYKDVIGELSLDDAWRLVDGAKAITFTPKEGGREHIGLAAEWMHEIDPRVTTVDAEGRPDWVQYPHLVAPIMLALSDTKRRMIAAGLWN